MQWQADAVASWFASSRHWGECPAQIAVYSGSGSVAFWLYAKDSESNPLNNFNNPPRFHLAFKASNRETVDNFYTQAIANQGRDNGEPAIRSQYHPKYYAAYVFNPDDYKLEAVCHS